MSTAVLEPPAAKPASNHPAQGVGGQYKATQNSDGTWNLLDVPICCEASAKELGTKKAMDREWLTAALDQNKRKMAEDKYLPPVHLDDELVDDGHHNGKYKPKGAKAGELVLKRVADLKIDGTKRAAMFADIVNIPAEVMALLEKRLLPYRSIEALDLGNPEISSLALMSHTVPFFRMPMTTVGEKVPYGEAMKAKAGSPVVAFRAARGGSRAILFSFGGATMAADELDAKCKPGEEKAKMEEEPTPDTPTSVKPDEDPAKDPAAKMEAALAAIGASLAQIAAKLGIGSETAQAAAHPDVPVAPGTLVAAAAKEGAESVSLAEMRGQIVALKAQVSAAAAEKEQADLVAGAEKELDGYHLPDTLKADLSFFASQGKDQMSRFVASIKANMPKDPPADVNLAVRVPAYPEEVLKLAAKGPDVLAEAKTLWEGYNVIRNAGGLKDIAFDRYFELNRKGAQ